MEPSERLIVAADFDPKEEKPDRTIIGVSGVHEKVLQLANDLSGLGVYIKVNSILRAMGYSLISELHEMGLRVFADLKLNDIPNTMKTDAAMLWEYCPDIVTVMCSAGIDGLARVREQLPDTNVLGVTVLTSLDEENRQAIFTCSTKAGVLRFAMVAKVAGLDDLILSPKEVGVIQSNKELALSCNTPGIRPEWSLVEGDDQSRVMTTKKAIKIGAKRVVIGRPILGAKPNDEGRPQSPREAVERTLEEIKEGLEAREG